MYRLAHLVDGEWKAHSHPQAFDIDPSSERSRIIAGVPAGDPAVVAHMAECLKGPFYLLYVLHTPRGEGSAGRYQSSLLSLADIKQFLVRFNSFLSSDARYDLWLHSPGEDATIVWDRHNRLFAYGPLESFSTKLASLGYSLGQIDVPSPHQHHYRAEFDEDARALLMALDWTFSSLRPEDEQ